MVVNIFVVSNYVYINLFHAYYINDTYLLDTINIRNLIKKNLNSLLERLLITVVFSSFQHTLL